jgi:hypothetical protein
LVNPCPSGYQKLQEHSNLVTASTFPSLPRIPPEDAA